MSKRCRDWWLVNTPPKGRRLPEITGNAHTIATIAMISRRPAQVVGRNISVPSHIQIVASPKPGALEYSPTPPSSQPTPGTFNDSKKCCTQAQAGVAQLLE